MVDAVDVLERLGSNAFWGDQPFDVARDAEFARLDVPVDEAPARADAGALLQSLDVQPFQIMIFPAEEEEEDETDEDGPTPDAPSSE